MLIYNVVLISTAQQRDSVIHICIYSFSYFFPITVINRVLNIVPCAIQGICAESLCPI